MNHDLAAIQNDDTSLQLLHTISKSYTFAKRILWGRFFLVYPVVGGALLFAHTQPPTSNWWGAVTAISALVYLLDEFLLQKQQNVLQERGATLQEQFDCRVLDLEWHEAVTGHRPSLLDLELDIPADRRAGWRDWYPPVVAELPIWCGRLICQISNAQWDHKLRVRVQGGAGTLFVLFCLAVLIFGGQKTVNDFLLNQIFPMLPALVLTVKYILGQNQTDKTLQDIATQFDRAWQDTLATGDAAKATVSARHIQDRLYQHRKTNPQIPEWVYQRLRDKNEIDMNIRAARYVDDAKARCPKDPKSDR